MIHFYYVKTLAYNMVVVDHGNYRAYLTDSSNFDVSSHRDKAQEFLKSITDDSSWETTEASVEELTKDSEILCEVAKLSDEEYNQLAKDIKALADPSTDSFSLTLQGTEYGFYVETWKWKDEYCWAIELDEINADEDWHPLYKEYFNREDTSEGVNKLVEECANLVEVMENFRISKVHN